MGALIALALWAPTWELGATLGPGVVDDRAALLATPWGGVQTGPFEVALQAPLRFELGEARLRPQDWDEVADAGRVLRFARYGEALGIGTITDLTLGHGTLVRRYHGGVDDDTHRLGALLTLEDDAFGGLLFVDQLLGPPVVGARLEARPRPRLTMGLTAVADSAAPGDEVVPAYGIDVAYEVTDGLSLYLDGNGVERAPGVHLGLAGELRRVQWSVSGLLEGMWADAGYDPYRFDFGYLVDRHRRPPPDTQALGGRAQAELGYAESLRVGAEYTDAQGPERASLSLWLRVPDERVAVTALWRTRGRRGRLLSPDDALAAAAVRVNVHPVWSLGATLARVWRPDADGVLRPGTDAALVAEAAFGL